MATLTIRSLSDRTRDNMRVAAARNGRSMEAEARLTLDRTYAGADDRSIDEYLAGIDALLEKFPAKPGMERTVADFLADRRAAAERGE